jgi:hypothetical protein
MLTYADVCLTGTKKAVRGYVEEQIHCPTNSEEDLSMNPGWLVQKYKY